MDLENSMILDFSLLIATSLSVAEVPYHMNQRDSRNTFPRIVKSVRTFKLSQETILE